MHSNYQKIHKRNKSYQVIIMKRKVSYHNEISLNILESKRIGILGQDTFSPKFDGNEMLRLDKQFICNGNHAQDENISTILCLKEFLSLICIFVALFSKTKEMISAFAKEISIQQQFEEPEIKF